MNFLLETISDVATPLGLRLLLGNSERGHGFLSWAGAALQNSTAAAAMVGNR